MPANAVCVWRSKSRSWASASKVGLPRRPGAENVERAVGCPDSKRPVEIHCVRGIHCVKKRWVLYEKREESLSIGC